MAKNHLSGKLAVILHADVAGSTELVRQDEQLAHQRIRDTFHRFGNTISKYHGHVRELRGDALLAEFDRASDAVATALAFQAEQSDYNTQLSDNIQPSVRVGIAMGEVIIADDTITGTGVVLAQRLEQLSEPGGVVIQGAAYETIPGRFPFEYEDLGEHEVKGFDKPVRVYSATLKSETELPQPDQLTQSTRGSKVALTAIILIIAALALMWLKPWEVLEEPGPEASMPLPLPDKPSIAVLPFTNLSGNPEQEYFSDGITNDIITDLSKFNGLFVIASNSTFTYKGKPMKVQEVAEDLGVRYVLEGSVQRLGDNIRINAQLIDAISGGHLWAERYERDTGDLFAIQSEIIETIVGTLAFKVEMVERERVFQKDTVNLAAYDYYLLGRKAQSTFTKETMTEARRLYEKALELDPNYAQAYVSLGFVHSLLHAYDWTENTERSLEIALEMARKAVTLRPDAYESHWVLGQAYKKLRDFDRARAEFERALELNPNDASLLAGMVEFLVHTGRAEEAIAQCKLAMRINPHYPDWYLWNLGWAQYFAGDYEEALSSLKRMSNPPNGARRTLAAVLVRLGRVEEARAVIAAFREKAPDFTVRTMENFAFQNRTYLEQWMEDLRIAGLPE